MDEFMTVSITKDQADVVVKYMNYAQEDELCPQLLAAIIVNFMRVYIKSTTENELLRTEEGAFDFDVTATKALLAIAEVYKKKESYDG
jgi:hypothetical protein